MPSATTPGMMQHHAQDEESSDDGEGYNDGPMTGDMHDMNAQDTESSSDSDDSDGDIGDAQGISGMAEDGEAAFKVDTLGVVASDWSLCSPGCCVAAN
jgi:hypothetical protein